MPRPTLGDYKQRLARLLARALASAGQAYAQLTLDGAAHGEFADTSSGFRLRQEQLAHNAFVIAMELALTECRRVTERLGFDHAQVFDATCDAVHEHLDALVEVVIPPANVAFMRKDARGPDQAALVREVLKDLMGEVFWEYDLGLYALPGDPGAPVVINVANVYGSNVGNIQQSGNGSVQQERR